jgi:hypothetical protein
VKVDIALLRLVLTESQPLGALPKDAAPGPAAAPPVSINATSRCSGLTGVNPPIQQS